MKPLNHSSIYSQLDGIEFVSVPEIVAYFKTKMYMGSGIEFHHNDKKIHDAWHKIAENNDAFNFLFERIMDVGKTGGTIIGVEQTEAGIPLWTYADPFMVNGIEQSYATHDMVVIIQKTKIDNSYTLLKTCYDKENIYRTLWSGADNKQLDLLGFVSKLPKEKQIKWGTYDKKNGVYIYKHNLGMVPFVVIPNKPFLQKWPMYNASTNNALQEVLRSPLETAHLVGSGETKWQFNQLCDTANCTGAITSLQNAYTQMNKLMILDKPRIVITGATQYTQNGAAKSKAVRDVAMSDILYLQNMAPNAQAKIDTLAPTNSIDHYVNIEQTLWSDIFRASGLDWIIQSGTNKTTSENYLNFAHTTTTINAMKHFITDKIIRLIRISLKFMGYDLGDTSQWNFLVKSNIPTDMSSKRQDLSIDLKNGIIDQADMYMILYNVDRDNAENKIKAVKKFNASVGFDPMGQNIDGVSYPKEGESSANSKNAGRPNALNKKVG